MFGTFWTKSGEKIALGEEFAKRDERAYTKLADTSRSLEQHFKDMQQYEFVYSGEDNLLYILQSQPGRRTPKAGMKIAVDMVAQRLLTEREALLRIDSSKVNYFLQPHFDAAQLEHCKAVGK